MTLTHNGLTLHKLRTSLLYVITHFGQLVNETELLTMFCKQNQLPFSSIQWVLPQLVITFVFPVFTFEHFGFHADYSTLAHSSTFYQQYHVVN